MSQVNYAEMPQIQVEEDDWDEIMLDLKINPVTDSNPMGSYCFASALWSAWELETGKIAKFEQFYFGEDHEKSPF